MAQKLTDCDAAVLEALKGVFDYRAPMIPDSERWASIDAVMDASPSTLLKSRKTKYWKRSSVAGALRRMAARGQLERKYEMSYEGGARRRRALYRIADNG